MTGQRRWYAASAFSAVLMAVPFVAPKLSFLVLAGLIPFFLSLANSENPKFAWKLGYVFGAVTLAFQIIFFFTLTERWTQSFFLGLIPWILGIALGSCYYGLLGWGIYRLIKRNWLWAIPFTWAGMEVVRSYIPVLAFPWGLAATPLAEYPWLVHFAHWGTIYGASAWAAAVSALVVGLAARPAYKSKSIAAKKTSMRILTACVVLPLCLDFIPLSGATKPMRILLCQPGIDTGYMPPQQAAAALQKTGIADMKLAAKLHADLTVFPEGFARIFTTSRLDPGFPLNPKTPVIFGAQRGTSVIHQSAFSFDGDWHWADKTRLVIFGEYVPGRNVIPFLNHFNLPSADITPGDKNSVLPVAGITAGPMICFEALFPDISYRLAMDHAQLLCVISDDAWFVGSPAPHQLNLASVWRAIETGLPLVRSGMTGFTDVVDSSGHVSHRLPFGPPGTDFVTVHVPTDPGRPWWLPIFPAVSLASLLLWLLTGSPSED